MSRNKKNAKKDFLKILIVDDELIFLSLIEEVFACEGIKIQTTGDSTVAMKIIEEKGVDILVTDLKMPKFNGIDLATKAINLCPDTQIIFMTGYNDAQKETTDFQNYFLLKKPFHIEEIVNLIKHFV